MYEYLPLKCSSNPLWHRLYNMKPLKIYYPVLHISEDTCEVWNCDHGEGISYRYLNNWCDDWVHEPSFIRTGLVTRERSLGKTPGLLLGSYFIKYSRKLETVFQFWTYSGVWFNMVQSQLEKFLNIFVKFILIILKSRNHCN